MPQVDDSSVKKRLPGRFFELNIHFGVFLGGQGDFSELFLGHMENFRGCMEDVSILRAVGCLSNVTGYYPSSIKMQTQLLDTRIISIVLVQRHLMFDWLD